MIFKVKIDAACVHCGTRDKKHKALGMCENCYRKARRREKAPLPEPKQKANT